MSNEFKDSNKFGFVFTILGSIILLLGFGFWIEDEKLSVETIKRQNLDKPTYSKCCQSCGKTFSSFIIWGTEKDNKKNFNYCNSCFSEGEFVENQITVYEVKNRIKKELSEKKVNKRKINKIVKKINSLDRWKHNNYI